MKIREGQRRIASILFVSNLHDSILKKIGEIETACKDQLRANDLVDTVIKDECTEIMSKRIDEANLLKAQIRRVLRLQLDTMNEVSYSFVLPTLNRRLITRLSFEDFVLLI